MADIFISYSRSDRLTLDQLLPQIHNAFPNHIVWFDEKIPGGDDWWQRILEEISKCLLFLHLISDEAVESEHCQNELRHALDLNKPVVPVLIRRLRTDYLDDDYTGSLLDDLIDELKKKQRIDLSGGLDGHSTSKLWGTMTQILFASPTPSDRHITLSRKERWILSNQFAILAKLYPEDADSYDNMS